MTRIRSPIIFATCVALVGTTLAAKDSLGVFSGWAAFRDNSVPRCYAIAKPETVEKESKSLPYAAFGSWPKTGVRNQLHIRLSNEAPDNARVTLRVGNRNFTLASGGINAWARDPAMDAAIVAAIRSADRMVVRSIGANGRRIADSYALAGAATAIDAATLACSRRAS